jgi:2-oxoglutarate dehydrogenase E1 component
MQPKSLLRLPQAASRLEELTNGRFSAVIDDQTVGERRDEVQRVVFCTGKLFYDLTARERPANIAIARVEELYPWPAEQISRIVDLCPNATEVAWAQEEPKNMGAWSYVAPRLRACTGNAMLIRYIGRPERASPAEGYVTSHQEEQARIVADALEVPAKRKATARS